MFKQAYIDLSKKDPLIMASSTAYFTLFALPAIFFVLLNVLGILLNPEIVSGQLFRRLQDLLGSDIANQVEQILGYFQNIESNWKFLIVGSVFFFIVSTTLFIVIEKSINKLWDIMPRPKNKFLGVLKKRVVSLLVILIGGILVLLSLVIDTLINILQDFLPDIIFNIDIVALAIINKVVAFSIITLWFALLFKMIPDARIKWKIVWVGAIITSILFTGGMILLRFLFIDKFGEIYGSASAIVSLLIFIFYVSLLIYYGAAFTKAFAVYKGEKVKPSKHAVNFTINIENK